MKKIFFFFFFFCVLASPFFALAADCDGKAVCLNVPIGKSGGVDNFSEYVALWYNFVLGTVGIIAAVMIMWGGFRWLTSRGEPEVIKDAKERIIAAITGLVLAFLSFTILNLINPRLVELTMPELTIGDFSELGLDADEGKPVSSLPSGTASADINDLNDDAKALHNSLMQDSGCNPQVTSTRRSSPGSQHNTGNAIDYARDDGCFNNYMENLCRSGTPEGKYNGQQIYRVKFPNGQSGRIIDEHKPENNCWHVDLRQY